MGIPNNRKVGIIMIFGRIPKNYLIYFYPVNMSVFQVLIQMNFTQFPCFAILALTYTTYF